MPLSLFDSNLGTLTGASLTVTGNMDAYMAVTNRATVTRASTLTLMSDIGIRSSLVGVNQLFDNFSDIPLSNTIGPIQIPPATPTLFGPFIDQKVLTKDLSTALAELSAPGGGSFTINCTSLSGVRLAGGGGNIRGAQTTMVGCGATITYTYDPAPPIDLTLTKTVTSTGPYIVGSNVTYSLLARNLGPGVAQPAIVVKDLLPAGLTYVSATGTNWSCAAAGQTITCTRAAGASTLAANASADAITVTAKVATGATGSLLNMAQVNPAGNETVPESSPLGTATGGYEDGNPASGSNNDASATVAVTDRIDLTLTKTVTSTGPYIVGSNVTYSLLARNLGLGTAQAAIVVKDLLPAGLTYVSATGTNWSCAAAGQTITCTRDAAAGTLAANASADAITVVAKIDAAVATGTSLVNYAQVAPAGNETVPESSPLGTATGGYEDGNPASGSNNDDSKAIVVAAAAAIPTLNEWMLLLLSVMLGLLAMRQAQGRRHMK